MNDIVTTKGYFRCGKWYEERKENRFHVLEIIPNEKYSDPDSEIMPFDPVVLLDGKKIKCLKNLTINIGDHEWVEATITLVCNVKGKIPFEEETPCNNPDEQPQKIVDDITDYTMRMK